MSPALLGFLRGIGMVVLAAVLSYLGDEANLSGIVSASLATIVSGIALSLEHSLESKGKGALFGAVKR